MNDKTNMSVDNFEEMIYQLIGGAEGKLTVLRKEFKDTINRHTDSYESFLRQEMDIVAVMKYLTKLLLAYRAGVSQGKAGEEVFAEINKFMDRGIL